MHTQAPPDTTLTHTHAHTLYCQLICGLCVQCSCRRCKVIPYYPGCLYSAGESAVGQWGLNGAAVYSSAKEVQGKVEQLRG